MQETGGGRNVYGHDPTIFVGAGPVTEENYAEYKTERDATGKCQGVGPTQLCVAPGTPVLTADLRWEAAEKITAGERIIAFDEEGTKDDRHPMRGRRFFRTAVVEDMAVSEMERVRVRTDRREITVTPIHKFLTWRPERYTWREARRLTPGDVLPSVPVWTEDESYLAGYLAGQFDGEGCLTISRPSRHGRGMVNSKLLWTQTADSPDIPFMQTAMETLGFQIGWHKSPPRGWAGEETSRGKPVVAVRIAGTWWDQLRFIGTVRPRRMLRHPRLQEMWELRQLNACDKETVVSVDSLEPGPMVAHKTSTQTLITNGLLSHNTWKGYQDQADALGGCWKPIINMTVGFGIVKGYRDNGLTWHEAWKRYNGSDAYADQMDARYAQWRTIMKAADVP